jgi:hypothetical protein
VHYITTLLHPTFKPFGMNPHLKTKAIDLVKKEILQRYLLSTNNGSSTTVTSLVSTSTSDTQLTHSSSLLSKCFDLSTITQTPSSTSAPFDELDEYMNLNIRLNENDDILLFWLQHQSKFPILTSIVQDYFAVPASNTIVERLFSSSKNTVSDKRTRLGAEKINKILFLQKNLLKLKSFDKTPVNEVIDIQLKRKTAEPSSSSTSFQDQEQMVAAASKKIKLVEQDNIVICDDDSEENEENDGIDCF